MQTSIKSIAAAAALALSTAAAGFGVQALASPPNECEAVLDPQGNCLYVICDGEHGPRFMPCDEA